MHSVIHGQPTFVVILHVTVTDKLIPPILTLGSLQHPTDGVRVEESHGLGGMSSGPAA